jgi:hypothetical protein
MVVIVILTFSLYTPPVSGTPAHLGKRLLLTWIIWSIIFLVPAIWAIRELESARRDESGGGEVLKSKYVKSAAGIISSGLLFWGALWPSYKRRQQLAPLAAPYSVSDPKTVAKHCGNWTCLKAPSGPLLVKPASINQFLAARTVSLALPIATVIYVLHGNPSDWEKILMPALTILGVWWLWKNAEATSWRCPECGRKNIGRPPQRT